MPVVEIKANLPNADDDLILSRRTKPTEIVPAYTCIGGNMVYKTKETSYPDLFEVLKNLSPSGTWFFWTLTEKRDLKTNIAVYDAVSPTEAQKITRAYKELFSLDIVKRIKKQHYLINPKVMLPEKGEYVNVKNHWNSL